MGNQRNYAKELDKIIESIIHIVQADDNGIASPPRLLLHSCCAPCSSYVLEYLQSYFEITVFYYNPNITEDTEYQYRLQEQKKLIQALNRQAEEKELEETTAMTESSSWDKVKTLYPIKIIDGDYKPELFFKQVKGLEDCPEGGERCFRCYQLRLEKAAQLAAEQKFDYFTTSLTISPMKNAAKLNEIGEQLEQQYGVAFLPSDFKKKNGYKRSIELSEEYGLYRQNYCGCVYSKRDAALRSEVKKVLP